MKYKDPEAQQLAEVLEMVFSLHERTYDLATIGSDVIKIPMLKTRGVIMLSGYAPTDEDVIKAVDSTSTTLGLGPNTYFTNMCVEAINNISWSDDDKVIIAIQDTKKHDRPGPFKIGRKDEDGNLITSYQGIYHFLKFLKKRRWYGKFMYACQKLIIEKT